MNHHQKHRLDHLYRRLSELLGVRSAEAREIAHVFQEILTALQGHRAASTEIAVPRYTTEEGTVMPESITIASHIRSAEVPMIFRDASGVVCPPPPGGTITSDNEAVATAVLASDDSNVVITRVTAGACTLSYSNGAISDTLAVTVVADEAVAVSEEFDTANAKFTPE